MRIKIEGVACYNGHSIRSNGSIDVNVKFDYGELTNVIQLQQLLNNDIKIMVRKPNEKPFSLGTFRLHTTTIGSDGETKAKFNGLVDYVETDNLNRLIPSEIGERFRMRFDAEVELEEEDEEE